MSSPLGNRRNGYESSPITQTIDDDTMQQYYHLFALEAAPELEARIAAEVDRRCQTVFYSHQNEMSNLQRQLTAEQDKNALLTQRYDARQKEFIHILNDVDNIRADLQGENKKNPCIVM